MYEVTGSRFRGSIAVLYTPPHLTHSLHSLSLYLDCLAWYYSSHQGPSSPEPRWSTPLKCHGGAALKSLSPLPRLPKAVKSKSHCVFRSIQWSKRSKYRGLVVTIVFGNLAMCFCSLQRRGGEIESGVLIGCRGDELIEGAV
jgi:hypothetical protein